MNSLNAVAALAPPLLLAAGLLLLRYPLLFLAYRQLRPHLALNVGHRTPFNLSLFVSTWMGRLALALFLVPTLRVLLIVIEQGVSPLLVGVLLMLVAITIAAAVVDLRVGWAMRRVMRGEAAGDS
jgi:hypothetical protein